MKIMLPVWPTAAANATAEARLSAIAGAKVAIVDDGYDIDFMDELAHVLREDFGANVILFPKPHGSKGSPPSLIDEAAKCDVAIVGIAQ